jgi:hypothetical protein
MTHATYLYTILILFYTYYLIIIKWYRILNYVIAVKDCDSHFKGLAGCWGWIMSREYQARLWAWQRSVMKFDVSGVWSKFFFWKYHFRLRTYSIRLHIWTTRSTRAAQVGTELVEATKNYDAEALIGLQKDQIFTFLQVEAIQKSSDGPTEWTIGTVDSGWGESVQSIPISGEKQGEKRVVSICLDVFWGKA